MDTPSEDEFAAWREHPVTRWVEKAYEKMAEEQKAAWVEQSWEGGHTDSFELCALRTRADAYKSMSEASLSDFAAAIDPDAEEPLAEPLTMHVNIEG